MKFRHAFSSSAFACLALAFVSGCGKQAEPEASASGGENIASVNGQAISTKDYQEYLMMRKNTVLVQTQQGAQAATTLYPLGLQALRDMVDRKIILQVAKDEGVMPTDAQVQAELDYRNKQSPGYTDTFVKGGVSLDDLKQDIILDLAREGIITKGVTITQSDIDNYIKENPKQFTEPASDDLLILGVRDAAKKAAVDKDLAANKPFKDVTTQYSDLPNKATGGASPKTPVAGLPAEIRTALDKTAPLHATDWLAVQGVNFKLYVLAKNPEKKVDMTPDKRKELQRSLAMQRGQMTSDLQTKIQDKLKSANIDVSDPQLKKPFEELMAQVKRAASTPPRGAAPTPPPVQGGTPPPSAPPSVKSSTAPSKK